MAMKTIPREALPRLPENCAVRLIDLEVNVGGLIAVDEEGFVNIYLNARLSRDAQLKALRHELRHYYRDDLYSEADIREVERLADGPMALDILGAPVPEPAPVFDPEAMKAVGRGLYLPLGENRVRAAGDLSQVRASLMEACGIYDVMRGEPAAAMMEMAEGLSEQDIAFIAWQPPGAALPVALRFYRESGARLQGALYYAGSGCADNAMAIFELDPLRVTVDLRRRGHDLAVYAIAQEREGRYEKIY